MHIDTVQVWARFSSSILKRGYWNRLGNLAKSLTTLPDDITAIYDEIEARIPVKLNEDVRLMYYTEFTRLALGSTSCHFRDVETLIYKKNPEITISKIDFLTLMTNKLHESAKGTEAENNEYFDFEHFAVLIYELLKFHTDMSIAKEGKWRFKDILRKLPLDPDSGRKQAWDVLCLLLLLYCSFSVPYDIAFDSADQGPQAITVKDVFEAAMDIIFMADILLNFITGWDNQGLVVRDFSLIAKQYLRTWFIADFAGSFPFDKLITAFVDADRQSLSSTTLLRGLRLVRMLKLIRAIKFMNKLEKLKQNEGFEAFGAAISLASSVFFLFYTAHLLGCFYTILASYEDEGNNWLYHYRPELVGADETTRYVVALYWAIITIST
eukprot:CAMPEP_0172177164 /NCGR_PEP_ID=MMETSP1050-20130122/15269_1 /TAXON_ID=233186 /ORGANISM="Cryptomonas curvata, Strain CCAP979/52" /LENGTH=380 /DNA_ID=CAMNT_0012849623 /DNA_START=228 /DNA_END=1366 /DNA_ORIENTATION=-